MDKGDIAFHEDSQIARLKRVRRLKHWIIAILLLLILTPTLLCIILFYKMNSMEKQMDLLMRNEYKYSESIIKTNKVSSSVKNDKNLLKVLNSQLGFNENLVKLEKGFPSEDELSMEQNIKLLSDSKDFIQDMRNVQMDNQDNSKVNSNIQLSANDTTSVAKTNDSDKNNVVSSEDAKGEQENSLEQNLTVTKSDGINQKEQSEDQNQNIAKQLSSKSDVQKIEDSNQKDKKEVYLTFDDGPSKYTPEILDLLAEYNVKATFFVIGKTDHDSKAMYKRIAEEGHALGMHSYSHNYNEIYQSLDNFEKDFIKIHKLLFDTTGIDVNLYRFPGGSGNTVSKIDMSVFINFLYKKSVTYFDWNVVSGDATGEDLTAKEMYENVMNGIKENKKSIVLMHDTDSKKDTVKALRMILDGLKKEKAELLPLDNTVVTMQQVKVNSVVHRK